MLPARHRATHRWNSRGGPHMNAPPAPAANQNPSTNIYFDFIEIYLCVERVASVDRTKCDSCDNRGQHLRVRVCVCVCVTASKWLGHRRTASDSTYIYAFSVSAPLVLLFPLIFQIEIDDKQPVGLQSLQAKRVPKPSAMR